MSDPNAPLALTFPDPADREDAGAFVARAARMDPGSLVRVRGEGESLRLWATTPFETLVTRVVGGRASRPDATVHAANLLPGLAVARGETVDPGPVVDPLWHTQLPPPGGWTSVDVVPAAAIAELNEAGSIAARDAVSPAGGTSTALLDQEVLTVTGAGLRVVVPMRVVFAFAGMGFAGRNADEVVHVRATDAWLRLDGRFGSVVRRRHSLLPLLF